MRSRMVGWAWVGAGLFGFVAAMGAAMAFYPGGTSFDAHTNGYSFWSNFWCDLTKPIAFNGAPNAVAARLAVV